MHGNAESSSRCGGPFTERELVRVRGPNGGVRSSSGFHRLCADCRGRMGQYNTSHPVWTAVAELFVFSRPREPSGEDPSLASAVCALTALRPLIMSKRHGLRQAESIVCDIGQVGWLL